MILLTGPADPRGLLGLEPGFWPGLFDGIDGCCPLELMADCTDLLLIVFLADTGSVRIESEVRVTNTSKQKEMPHENFIF